MLTTLRYVFELPNKKETQLRDEKVALMWELAQKRVEVLNKEKEEKVDKTNNICPKCQSKNVVNKFIKLAGTGYGWGNFKIDTNEINNCNDCGNQWKKFVLYYTNKYAVAASWIESVYKCLLDNEKDFEKRNGADVVKTLKDWNIYAESIEWIFHNSNVQKELSYSTTNGLKISMLRKEFKTIYQKNKS